MTDSHRDVRPRASVIIRCYNEADHIGAVLTEIEQQGFGDYEIIAVDSGSTDGTLDILSQHRVRLFHIRKEDFSFGRSLNIGCEAAEGEFLVLLSAHCYPSDGAWLENLLKGFDDPSIAAIYGQQRGIPGKSAFSEIQVLRRWFPDESRRRQDNSFLNNANCAVRKAVWEELPYDETLPGLEDVAWAEKVTARGWGIGYRADARVYHVHNETYTQVRNRYQREAITFQRVFPGEHFNVLDFVRLSGRNIAADWGAARRERVLLRNVAKIVLFRLAQFWGTYRGFHTRWPASSELKRRFYYPDD